MERAIAEDLMKILLSLDAPLNLATELTKRISDVEERKLIRRGLGEIGGHIFTEIMLPIIRQYPDLDPTKEKPAANTTQ